MLDLLKAFKHCYHGDGTCKNCPYENNQEKCKKMFDNIKIVLQKIGELVELENIQNIVKIVLNKENNNNENKN